MKTNCTMRSPFLIEIGVDEELKSCRVSCPLKPGSTKPKLPITPSLAKEDLICKMPIMDVGKAMYSML